jgi:hypothetical protein
MRCLSRRLLIVIGICTLTQAQPAPLNEYQVKAAYLYNFAKFVEWPKQAFASDSAPIRICILGPDVFGPALRDVTRGKTINGRYLDIEDQVAPAKARSCQVVFASREMAKLNEALPLVAGAPNVLTVGEHKDFLERGGIINLVLENDRVRFEVNAGAAKRAGLKISAQLLSLARQVKDE